MKEIKYLNDKVIKKALAKEKREIRNYVARIISDTTHIPYEVLEDNLELVYPEVSVNSFVVNSEVDLIFKEGTMGNMYFNIEINYGRSGVLRRKNMSYTFQLALRDIKTSKEYKNKKQVFQININAYDPYGYGDLVYEAGMMLKKYNIEYSDIIKIYEINLAYYKKIQYNEIEREELLKDLAIFVIEEEEVLEKLYKGDRVMEEVKKEMDGYIREIDEILFYNEEDLQRQIEEEMMEKGEKKSRIEIAKKMLFKNKSIEEICEFTELSREEIERLKNQVF